MNRKKAAIKEKLAVAKTFFDEVPVHLSHKFLRTAINRIYYSCFHATQALLLTKDLMPKTHKGASTLLHEHFVKNGSFDKTKSDFYSKLLNERMESDYSNTLLLEETDIENLMKPAKAYIEYVTKLIEDCLAE